MENRYLYIENNTWNYSDGVFNGIANITPENVSIFCREKANDMRLSDLGNYDELSKDERKRLAKLWEAAINLPDGKYDYYFNLEDKREVFIKSVQELAARLCINYELIIKE